ncbi:uncharacterized protein [Atheta coriaria]|uniref:uncharacterized protein n=1 Tax=Dalotia coriaria TaxID=877792 RepID=UPI0031F44940
MKTASPVKAIAAKKSPGKPKSPFKKAKDVVKQASPQKTNGTPKSPKQQNAGGPKTPKQQNGGAPKTPKSQNGKFVGKVQNSNKKEKLNKVPVMNEASDDSGDSDSPSNVNIPKFAGTAALDEKKPVKKAVKNKTPPTSAPAEEDQAEPAKKIKKENKKGRKRIGLVITLGQLVQQKEFTKLKALLPKIKDHIQAAKDKKETISSKRKVRILEAYVKKIETGNFEKAEKPPKAPKQKNQPKVPKGLKLKKEKEEDDDGETWQDKLEKAGSDDEEEDDDEVEEEEGDNEEEEAEESDDDEDAPKPKQGKKLSVVKKAEENKGQPKSPKKTRYVLFVGNLSYGTTEEDIKEHFQKTGNVTRVHLGKHKGTEQSRGFAHIEFGTEEAYQRGLSLHHTQLNKRQINVIVSDGQNQKALTGSKRNVPRVKDMKLKGMKKQGLLAGSTKDSQKRSARRKKAAAGQAE